ncbi:hypothetical protein L0F63_003614 [Massospora cicadina]|nr:hypothetical protein L0F63_003614 [Massospora cicadina]
MIEPSTVTDGSERRNYRRDDVADRMDPKLKPYASSRVKDRIDSYEKTTGQSKPQGYSRAAAKPVGLSAKQQGNIKQYPLKEGDFKDGSEEALKSEGIVESVRIRAGLEVDPSDVDEVFFGDQSVPSTDDTLPQDRSGSLSSAESKSTARTDSSELVKRKGNGFGPEGSRDETGAHGLTLDEPSQSPEGSEYDSLVSDSPTHQVPFSAQGESAANDPSKDGVETPLNLAAEEVLEFNVADLAPSTRSDLVEVDSNSVQTLDSFSDPSGRGPPQASYYAPLEDSSPTEPLAHPHVERSPFPQRHPSTGDFALPSESLDASSERVGSLSPPEHPTRQDPSGDDASDRIRSETRTSSPTLDEIVEPDGLPDEALPIETPLEGRSSPDFEAQHDQQLIGGDPAPPIEPADEASFEKGGSLSKEDVMSLQEETEFSALQRDVALDAGEAYPRQSSTTHAADRAAAVELEEISDQNIYDDGPSADFTSPGDELPRSATADDISHIFDTKICLKEGSVSSDAAFLAPPADKTDGVTDQNWEIDTDQEPVETHGSESEGFKALSDQQLGSKHVSGDAPLSFADAAGHTSRVGSSTQEPLTRQVADEGIGSRGDKNSPDAVLHNEVRDPCESDLNLEPSSNQASSPHNSPTEDAPTYGALSELGGVGGTDKLGGDELFEGSLPSSPPSYGSELAEKGPTELDEPATETHGAEADGGKELTVDGSTASPQETAGDRLLAQNDVKGSETKELPTEVDPNDEMVRFIGSKESDDFRFFPEPSTSEKVSEFATNPSRDEIHQMEDRLEDSTLENPPNQLGAELGTSPRANDAPESVPMVLWSQFKGSQSGVEHSLDAESNHSTSHRLPEPSQGSSVYGASVEGEPRSLTEADTLAHATDPEPRTSPRPAQLNEAEDSTPRGLDDHADRPINPKVSPGATTAHSKLNSEGTGEPTLTIQQRLSTADQAVTQPPAEGQGYDRAVVVERIAADDGSTVPTSYELSDRRPASAAGSTLVASDMELAAMDPIGLPEPAPPKGEGSDTSAHKPASPRDLNYSGEGSEPVNLRVSNQSGEDFEPVSPRVSNRSGEDFEPVSPRVSNRSGEDFEPVSPRVSNQLSEESDLMAGVAADDHRVTPLPELTPDTTHRDGDVKVSVKTSENLLDETFETLGSLLETPTLSKSSKSDSDPTVLVLETDSQAWPEIESRGASNLLSSTSVLEPLVDAALTAPTHFPNPEEAPSFTPPTASGLGIEEDFTDDGLSLGQVSKVDLTLLPEEMEHPAKASTPNLSSDGRDVPKELPTECDVDALRLTESSNLLKPSSRSPHQVTDEASDVGSGEGERLSGPTTPVDSKGDYPTAGHPDLVPVSFEPTQVSDGSEELRLQLDAQHLSSGSSDGAHPDAFASRASRPALPILERSGEAERPLLSPLSKEITLEEVPRSQPEGGPANLPLTEPLPAQLDTNASPIVEEALSKAHPRVVNVGPDPARTVNPTASQLHVAQLDCDASIASKDLSQGSLVESILEVADAAHSKPLGSPAFDEPLPRESPASIEAPSCTPALTPPASQPDKDSHALDAGPAAAAPPGSEIESGQRGLMEVPLEEARLEGPSEAVATRPAPLEVDEKYGLKPMRWFSQKEQAWRELWILTQNENGPCPLLALCNVLILRGGLTVTPKDEPEIHFSDLIQLLGAALLSRSHQFGDDPKMLESILAFLPTLRTGLDVNVGFQSVRSFGESPEGVSDEMALFGAFGVELVHGWVPDPIEDQEAYRVLVLGPCGSTYNGAMDFLVRVDARSDALDAMSPESAEHDGKQLRSMAYSVALVVTNFLEVTATQLTYHGLTCLSTTLPNDYLCVLFRNNHFLTLYKRTEGELYLLVTDSGYGQSDLIVWESLQDLDQVDSQFFTSEFTLSSAASQPEGYPPHAAGPSQALEQSDRNLALSLQRQEDGFGAVPPPPPAVTRGAYGQRHSLLYRSQPTNLPSYHGSALAAHRRAVSHEPAGDREAGTDPKPAGQPAGLAPIPEGGSGGTSPTAKPSSSPTGKQRREKQCTIS